MRVLVLAVIVRGWLVRVIRRTGNASTAAERRSRGGSGRHASRPAQDAGRSAGHGACRSADPNSDVFAWTRLAWRLFAVMQLLSGPAAAFPPRPRLWQRRLLHWIGDINVLVACHEEFL